MIKFIFVVKVILFTELTQLLCQKNIYSCFLCLKKVHINLFSVTKIARIRSFSLMRAPKRL